ncbi:MAG: hypothetical protein NVSMB5_21670 [Candidatus Velthaea sp.]
MKLKFLTASALTLAVTAGSLAPALADGAASTRNIILGIGAAAVVVTNVNRKKKIKAEEMREQSRRQSSYRSWYYNRYGRYPTEQQSRDWYVRTYHVNPS